MKELVELRPNRDLIDNEFSGYKLSLDPIATYEKDLVDEIDVVQPGDSQFSYAHARIFSLHNHLFINTYAPQYAFFIDIKWNIIQVTISSTNRIESIIKVGELPGRRPRNTGDFPVSLHFASPDRAVIGDGAGAFHVAVVKPDKWLIVFYDTSIPNSSIVAAACQEESKLHIVTKTVLEPKFEICLEWLTLDENWQTVSNRKVKIAKNLEYVGIEPPNALVVICPSLPQLNEGTETSQTVETPVKYNWTQTAQDVTIIREFQNIVKEDIKLELTSSTIKLTVKDEEILNGELSAGAKDPTWTLENNRLELVLQKTVEGSPWLEVVKGDNRGVQIQTERENEDGDQLFNSEELEDVDVTAQTCIFRLDLESCQVTHQVDLSTQQFLFSPIHDVSKTPAIVLRHLNDACVWQLEAAKETVWCPKHLQTFAAFGYVQASKTQRKFIVSPPDFSYVVISDAFKHLYLFRQPSPVEGTLRNRTSGIRVKAVAKQQLISLPPNEEILGIQATNKHLLVLTKSKIYVMVIKEEIY